LQLGGPVWPQREIVLDRDRLSVEQEAVLRIARAEIEQCVDRIDQPRAKRLEGPIPLAVPVGVADPERAHRRLRRSEAKQYL
jgi:hypothetical protein